MENKKKLRPAQVEKVIKGTLTAALTIILIVIGRKK
jgi:hypothetical protein